MPLKNPIIYEFIFRPAMLTYGVWEQVRMDHGQEFCLVSFAQTIMSHHRLVGTSEPFRMTTSTKNNVIERFWPEMNTRVNYPLKRALNTIIANDITDTLDESDLVFKFCLSWLTLYISKDAVEHLLNSWNHHRVPGFNGCIPAENMQQSMHMAQVVEFLVSSTPELVRMYPKEPGRSAYS